MGTLCRNMERPPVSDRDAVLCLLIILREALEGVRLRTGEGGAGKDRQHAVHETTGRKLNQTDKVVFAHFVVGPQGPTACPRHLLGQKLPTKRPLSLEKATFSITMESYFEAIEHFITINLESLRNVIAAIHEEVAPVIQNIRVVAEKSGSDYHPARLIVDSGSKKTCFAVNAAMTPRGLMRIDSEFDSMQFLVRHFRRKFVPSVYFSGAFLLSKSGLELKMFLTEWFEGYHEFHLAQDAGSREIHATLWETQHRISQLTERELRLIYQQAAHILTYYYDVAAYLEIYPWHHAAGDFVVSRTGNEIDVKLIAARQYASRFTGGHPGDSPVLEAAAVFLANLTIRMRLDRNHGVGEILWGPSHCVQDTILGFLSGLSAQIEEGRVPKLLCQQIVEFLRMIGPERLAEIFACVIDSYDPGAPDLKTIHDNSGEHVFEVFQTLRSMACFRN